jgi:hypothetical protein
VAVVPIPVAVTILFRLDLFVLLAPQVMLRNKALF